MKNNAVYKFTIAVLAAALIYVSFQKKQKIQVKPVLRRILPINVATRGIEDYRHIGILSGNKGKVLPLYGRRTYKGSSKWNYFTRANDHLSLRIPVSRDGYNCEEHIGCKELYNDDTLHVPEYNDNFKIKLYDTTPRYIPY